MGNISFDGEKLGQMIPTLGVAQHEVHDNISRLQSELSSIGTLWPGGSDDPLTTDFVKNYTAYEQNVAQFQDALGAGVQGQQGNLADAGSIHGGTEEENNTRGKF